LEFKEWSIFINQTLYTIPKLCGLIPNILSNDEEAITYSH
jgi:hypothetical protein